MVWQIAAAAGLNAIGSIIGAGAQNNAAKDATRAQTQAAQQQLALQREIYQDQRQLQQPYYQMGLQGMYGQSGLMNLLGFSQPGGGGQSGASPQPTTGQPTNAFANYASGTYGQQTPAQQEGDKWQGYLDANPDLMQHYSANNIANSGHLLGGGGKGADLDGNGVISPQEFGQYHYQTHGQSEGRSFGEPQTVGPAPTQPTSNPNIVANGDGSYGSGSDQNQLSAAPATPTEGPMTQTLRQTPGYQFMQDETQRMREGSAAARGELLSGGAIAEADRQVLGMADQTYQQSVNNAFNMANIGMGSAAQIQSAGNNFAAGASNSYAQQGQAAANGAYNRGNAFNAGLQGVGNAAMGGVGMYGASQGWF